MESITITIITMSDIVFVHFYSQMNLEVFTTVTILMVSFSVTAGNATQCTYHNMVFQIDNIAIIHVNAANIAYS